MRYKFKEIVLELNTDNLGIHHIRLDNVLNNQYFEVLSTTDKVQAMTMYQDLYDVLEQHMENQI